jgi:hypothetical protein
VIGSNQKASLTKKFFRDEDGNRPTLKADEYKFISKGLRKEKK